MKHYAVHFEDDPGKARIREELLDAHATYLGQWGERLLSAGVLSREGVDGAVGGWWLVKADSELEVREMVEGDPYFIQGLRRTVRIWRFSPVPSARE